MLWSSIHSIQFSLKIPATFEHNVVHCCQIVITWLAHYNCVARYAPQSSKWIRDPSKAWRQYCCFLCAAIVEGLLILKHTAKVVDRKRIKNSFLPLSLCVCYERHTTLYITTGTNCKWSSPSYIALVIRVHQQHLALGPLTLQGVGGRGGTFNFTWIIATVIHLINSTFQGKNRLTG